MTEQFRHLLWTVTGIGHIRKTRLVAEALRWLDGVIEAEVTAGGVNGGLLLEIDLMAPPLDSTIAWIVVIVAITNELRARRNIYGPDHDLTSPSRPRQDTTTIDCIALRSAA